MISIIIPAYNEEENIEKAYDVINSVLLKNKIENEIIFIDDGSNDLTYEKIKFLAMFKHNVSGICFSRNFGKEAAISAGLSASKGDCAVVIDCDLQHPPEKIIEMFRLWEQGYDIVEGIKKDSKTKKNIHGFVTNIFYAIISRVTGSDMTGSSDFKLLDRKVIDVLNKMPEKGFFRAISYWVGYKKATIEFNVQDRFRGNSKWNAVKLIKYAFLNISSFTTAPMQVVTIFGFLLLVFSIFLGIKAVSDQIYNTTLIIFTIDFIGSIIMISIGIIGYYIARIYEEIKGRPKYIIASVTSEEK